MPEVAETMLMSIDLGNETPEFLKVLICSEVSVTVAACAAAVNVSADATGAIEGTGKPKGLEFAGKLDPVSAIAL